MKNPYLKSLGNRIREVRLNAGLSQEKLAELSTLHRTYIGMIERGEKNLTVLNIKKISTALNTTPSELLKNL